MPTVILSTDVSCCGGAAEIREAAMDLPGVEEVKVSAGTGRVVVTGDADSAAIKRWLESKLGRRVAIVSDDSSSDDSDDDDDDDEESSSEEDDDDDDTTGSFSWPSLC